MTPGFTLRIPNLLEQIPPATELAAAWLLSCGAPDAHIQFARLAIDEVVSNCVKYGYDDSLEHHIEIELGFENSSLEIVITDDGHAFNPLDFPEPDTSLPVELRPIGGLGIHLLRKMADRLEYQRADGRNRLALLKTIQPTAKP
jgi:serine/threonine-protein kinase RsbW/sigma-B regulation protein RsbU (phosphoserine phosphatase)